VRFKDALDLARAAALSAALFLLGGVVPVLGPMAMLSAPAPCLIYALGRPGTYWRMSVVLALILAAVSLVAGPLQGLGFALSFGLATVLIVVMIRRQWAFESIVFAVSVAMMLATTAALMIWAGSPAALGRQIHEGLAAPMSHADGFYEKLGMSVTESKEVASRVLEITASLAPALGMMLSAVLVLINLGLVWRWLGKQGVGYQLFGGLTTWRSPEWLIWVLLLTGFGLFLPLEAGRIVATNGFVLVAAIYFCQGLAIMAYYLQMLSMPMIVRGTIYVIALLQPILAALVCLAGVFDMWIDFRRLKPPSQEAGSFDDFF
jgi:uncharacterized protein YybS (DUF2232 family)